MYQGFRAFAGTSSPWQVRRVQNKKLSERHPPLPADCRGRGELVIHDGPKLHHHFLSQFFRFYCFVDLTRLHATVKLPA